MCSYPVFIFDQNINSIGSSIFFQFKLLNNNNNKTTYVVGTQKQGLSIQG